MAIGWCSRPSDWYFQFGLLFLPSISDRMRISLSCVYRIECILHILQVLTSSLCAIEIQCIPFEGSHCFQQCTFGTYAIKIIVTGANLSISRNQWVWCWWCFGNTRLADDVILNQRSSKTLHFEVNPCQRSKCVSSYLQHDTDYFVVHCWILKISIISFARERSTSFYCLVTLGIKGFSFRWIQLCLIIDAFMGYWQFSVPYLWHLVMFRLHFSITFSRKSPHYSL